MKNILLFLFALFLAVSSLYSLRIRKYSPLHREIVPRSDLTVNVSNCKNSFGRVKICIYNSRKSYIEQRFPFRERSSLIAARSAVFKFTGLPCGDYAIVTFHDRNINGKLDRDILGMPKERYGYSNNLNVFYGRPGYGDAKFHFSGEATTMDIPLR